MKKRVLRSFFRILLATGLLALAISPLSCGGGGDGGTGGTQGAPGPGGGQVDPALVALWDGKTVTISGQGTTDVSCALFWVEINSNGTFSVQRIDDTVSPPRLCTEDGTYSASGGTITTTLTATTCTDSAVGDQDTISYQINGNDLTLTLATGEVLVYGKNTGAVRGLQFCLNPLETELYGTWWRSGEGLILSVEQASPFDRLWTRADTNGCLYMGTYSYDRSAGELTLTSDVTEGLVEKTSGQGCSGTVNETWTVQKPNASTLDLTMGQTTNSFTGIWPANDARIVGTWQNTTAGLTVTVGTPSGRYTLTDTVNSCTEGGTYYTFDDSALLTLTDSSPGGPNCPLVGDTGGVWYVLSGSTVPQNTLTAVTNDQGTRTEIPLTRQ